MVVDSLSRVEEWQADRVDDLMDIVMVALPTSGICDDDLLTCCWGRGGKVISVGNGSGAVAVRIDGLPGGQSEQRTGVIELVSVRPQARRRGVGRSLISAAEEWAQDRGASTMTLGGVGSLHLWPGVGAEMADMIQLAKSSGYRDVGLALAGSLPTSFRVADPDGVEIRRAVTDGDLENLSGYLIRTWPGKAEEAREGVRQGTCHGAFEGGEPVGFVCHSLNRLGWIGPLVVDPNHRRRGIGSALLGASCRDLMTAGLESASVVPAGVLGFLAGVGGEVSGVYRRFTKPISGRP